MKRPKITNVDSSTSMARSTAFYMKGKEFKNLGAMPGPMAPLMEGMMSKMNALSPEGRAAIYRWSSGNESVRVRSLHSISAEKNNQKAVNLYPKRRYQAVMIGSSNGAATHLCASLGIPWLPQTYLVPVRRTKVDPNEPLQEVAWAREPADIFLEANPDVRLYHMLDPVQDIQTGQMLAYFRYKNLILGEAYENFLKENLEPGGTIFLLECRVQWPSTRFNDRYIFQFGAPGGVEPEEYFHGGPRVEEYLSRVGFYRNRWEPPEPNGMHPEAEWGFDDELKEDVRRFAGAHGYRVRRIVFDRPEFLSPVVADLYRWWLRRRNIPGNRLLAQSFVLLEPYWTMRIGAAPFWMPFSTEKFDTQLEQYIRNSEPFDEIGITLFPHGMESIGLVSIERWRQILRLARKRGVFVGVDEEKFPRDLPGLVRYNTDISRQFSTRYPLPGYLTLNLLEEFLQQQRSDYGVRWEEGIPAKDKGMPGQPQAMEQVPAGVSG